jgi:hypothetical protein
MWWMMSCDICYLRAIDAVQFLAQADSVVLELLADRMARAQKFTIDTYQA